MTGNRLEVGVRELRNHLSRYLDRVAQGDEVLVTDRGRPVARLRAVDAATDRLARLVASGAVLAPQTSLRSNIARVVLDRPGAEQTASAVDAPP